MAEREARAPVAMRFAPSGSPKAIPKVGRGKAVVAQEIAENGPRTNVVVGGRLTNHDRDRRAGGIRGREVGGVAQAPRVLRRNAVGGEHVVVDRDLVEIAAEVRPRRAEAAQPEARRGIGHGVHRLWTWLM